MCKMKKSGHSWNDIHAEVSSRGLSYSSVQPLLQERDAKRWFIYYDQISVAIYMIDLPIVPPLSSHSSTLSLTSQVAVLRATLVPLHPPSVDCDLQSNSNLTMLRLANFYSL